MAEADDERTALMRLVPSRGEDNRSLDADEIYERFFDWVVEERGIEHRAQGQRRQDAVPDPPAPLHRRRPRRIAAGQPGPGGGQKQHPECRQRQGQRVDPVQHGRAYFSSSQ